MFDLYDLFQNRRINRASTDAMRAGHEASRANDQARRVEKNLNDQVDALKLACAAMWSLLSERCGVTESQLKDRMTEIDLRDGTLDGKVTGGTSKCRGCGRRIAVRRDHCLYCGSADIDRNPTGVFGE